MAKRPATAKPGVRPSPGPGSTKARDRVSISPSPQVSAYLAQLARLGVHGDTPTEVVEHLLSRELERLVAEGILKPA